MEVKDAGHLAVWRSRVSHWSWKGLDTFIGGSAKKIAKPQVAAAVSVLALALLLLTHFFSKDLFWLATLFPLGLKLYGEISKALFEHWVVHQGGHKLGKLSGMLAECARYGPDVLKQLRNQEKEHQQALKKSPSKPAPDLLKGAADDLAICMSKTFSSLTRLRNENEVFIFKYTKGGKLSPLARTRVWLRDVDIKPTSTIAQACVMGFKDHKDGPKHVLFVLEDLYFEQFLGERRRHDGEPSQGSAVGFGYLPDSRETGFAILVVSTKRRQFKRRDRDFYRFPFDFASSLLHFVEKYNQK